MIERIEYDDVLPLKSAAHKERVTMENPAGALWYGIKDGEKVVSFYCLVTNKNNARFKSNYTIPEYRRRGYLGEFIDHAKTICREKGIRKMTAFCTPLSIGQHLKHGASIKSERNDIAFIVYEMV